ncbi:MAG: twin-arginine translocase TatA/TatE family subunit [Chloroflexi bacterium]|nr:twin-arginine translocase TatA/TatE family subunit [Chloroflexota bacterium]
MRGFEDTRRFSLILKPGGEDRYRLVVIGRKRLPEIRDGGRMYWGFVDRMRSRADKLEEELEAKGVEPAARPAGEGVYVIARHSDHTHLAYALEPPEQPGVDQHCCGMWPGRGAWPSKCSVSIPRQDNEKSLQSGR